jgi:mersacidin/lichenicidin family type 2 lantibiotic
MNREQIIRAWKDEEYRAGLNDFERQLLPSHPAGIIELPETQMDDVAGGTLTFMCTINCTLGPICTQWLYSIYSGGTCRNYSFGCCPTDTDN